MIVKKSSEFDEISFEFHMNLIEIYWNSMTSGDILLLLDVFLENTGTSEKIPPRGAAPTVPRVAAPNGVMGCAEFHRNPIEIDRNS